MAKDLSKLLIIDLEATCWEKDTDRPTEETQEIIEIGIAELDLKKRVVLRSEGILIKPQYSKVSPFCEKLTTITQDMLDKEGILYSEAVERIKKDYNPYHYAWASYGDFDREMFRKNDELYKVKMALGRTHINVKNLFAMKQNLSREVGMEKALNILKLPLEGTHHRAEPDALNISKIVWSIL